MQVTVIIAARNAERTIANCVHALTHQSYEGEIEIIVVDDGSIDHTAKVARAAGADVLPISRSGPAVARNHGARCAQGKILLFTDADCVPDPDWIQQLVKPFSSAEVIATKGSYRTEQRSLTARFVQCEYESRYRRMRQLESIDFVDTYSAGFRAELFRSIGGFEEAFPTASVEDQEFSFRYGKLEGRMVFVPEAVVCHLHGDTLWRYFLKKVKIAYWKTCVMRRHPEKIISDSHTPQTVKAEMLCGLAVLATMPFATTPAGIAVCLGLASACLASALPFIIYVLQRDRPVGFVAPFLIALRAFGLGLGCMCGVLLLIRRMTRGKPSKPGDSAPKDPPSVDSESAVEEESHEFA